MIMSMIVPLMSKHMVIIVGYIVIDFVVFRDE